MYVCMYGSDGRSTGETGKRGGREQTYLAYLPTYLSKESVSPASSSWLQFNSSPLETQAFPSYPWVFSPLWRCAVRTGDARRARDTMRKHRVAVCAVVPRWLQQEPSEEEVAARPTGRRAWARGYVDRPTDAAQPSHCRSERYYTVVDRQTGRHGYLVCPLGARTESPTISQTHQSLPSVTCVFRYQRWGRLRRPGCGFRDMRERTEEAEWGVENTVCEL